MKVAFYALLFTAILVVGVLQRATLVHAYHLATSHYAEPYTELYLSDSTTLPLQVTAGKTYTYVVHLTNHEAKTKTYHLVAEVAIPYMPTVTTTTTLQLKDGSSADKEFSFTIPSIQQTATITVSVQGGPQHIQFRSKS